MHPINIVYKEGSIQYSASPDGAILWCLPRLTFASGLHHLPKNVHYIATFATDANYSMYNEYILYSIMHMACVLYIKLCIQNTYYVYYICCLYYIYAIHTTYVLFVIYILYYIYTIYISIQIYTIYTSFIYYSHIVHTLYMYTECILQIPNDVNGRPNVVSCGQLYNTVSQ